MDSGIDHDGVTDRLNVEESAGTLLVKSVEKEGVVHQAHYCFAEPKHRQKSVFKKLFGFQVVEEDDNKFDVNTAIELGSLGDERFLRAAVFIEDALHGRSTDHLTSPKAMKVYQMYHSGWARAIMTVNVFIQLSLAIFERPSANKAFDSSEKVWNLLEYFCLLLYGIEVAARYYYQGGRVFWMQKWNRAKIFVIAVMFLDETLRVGNATPVRYTRIFRPFFLAEKKRVRMVVTAILKTLPRIMDVTILFSFFVAVLGVIGYLLFLSTPQHDIFKSLSTTYVRLIVLITTANYPDVMMPAFDANGFYALYFIFFLFVALYILMNLMMAVIYTHYKNQQKVEVIDSLQLEQEGLKAAFHQLDINRTGEIDFATWQNLFRFLRPKFSLEKVAMMFYMVDYDDSKALDVTEFYRVVRVLKLRLRRTDWSKRQAQSDKLSQRNVYMRIYRGSKDVLKLWSRSILFDFVVDALIVTSGVISYLETRNVDTVADNAAIRWIDPAQFVFCMLFSAEQFIRIFGQGFARFWRSHWSRFDVVIVLCSFVAENVEIGLGTGAAGTSDLLRVILLVRVFRLFRLINGIRRFKVIVGTVFQLIPALWVFVQLLVCVYYFFAILGMEFFAGATYPGHPALIGTDYDSLGYYNNNFDSFPHAMVTLFELMVVNNWMVTMDGYAAVCGEASRTYFIMWWIISVVLIVNLIIAFILEAYFLQWEMNQGRKDLERKLRIEIGRAEARGQREGMLEQDIDLDMLEKIVEDEELGASGMRWQAEQRQHISDLLRIMHEAEIEDEMIQREKDKRAEEDSVASGSIASHSVRERSRTRELLGIDKPVASP